MNEANIQREIGVFMRKNSDIFEESMAVEVKLEKTRRFLLRHVKDHQIDGLVKAKTGMYYKISDFPVTYDSKLTRFTAKKPFDFAYFKVPKSYVGICFYVPRKKKCVYFVEVKSFHLMKADMISVGDKSLLEEEIKEYSEFCIDLLKQKRVYLYAS